MLVVFWILFAILVGLLGRDRKIGFGLSFFLSLILSPLIGLIFVLVSDKGTASKTILKHQAFVEEAKRFEFKGMIKEAIDNYLNALYHLENDYKNLRKSRNDEKMRLEYIEKIKRKIESLKEISKTDTTKEKDSPPDIQTIDLNDSDKSK